MLIGENDEKSDVWYMLALCLTKLGKNDSAQECLDNAVTLYKKFGLQDIELLEAIDEVRKELTKNVAKIEESKKDDSKMEDDDDGWEDYDEEDV